MVDVLVAGGRRVGAERQLVAGDRARHAQPRVGVDVVGADQPLRELVEDVVVLGQQLAGDVERDAVRAVLARCMPANRSASASSASSQSAALRGIARAARTHAELQRAAPRAGACGQMQRAALAAQLAEVGRMVGIAAHAGDAAAVVLDDDAAADAAIAAGRARLGQSQPSGCRARRRHDSHRLARAPRIARARSHRPARPARSPSAKLDDQLCSGQATRSPNTMPCDSGPPLCGQRSSSANTRSSAVRNTATLPSMLGRSITRAPSDGMSATRARSSCTLRHVARGRHVRSASTSVAGHQRAARTAAGRLRAVPMLVPGIGLAVERELQPLPQRAAAVGVVERSRFFT